MNYQDAVSAYRADSTNESLHKQAKLLTAEMTLKEKIYMLSGHPLAQIQKDMITTGRNYNVHALPGGGCKRLGVPPVLFTDGPRGVVMLNSTCFPSAAARASSFDPDLEYRVGKVIADEAIAQGANLFAGICINLVRNPRWGRTQEAYGEDPFLTGEMGKALTVSVQEEGMIACVKHFALNSMEDLRFYVDVHIDDRALHEVYLPHFKKCVDAGAQSIMGAYNRYEEYHCCENKKLLTDILRREWDFDGFVMSDFVWGTYNAEHSLRAGLDMEMMFTMKYSEANIKNCLNKGLLNIEHIDRAVQNILRALIRQQPNIKPRSLDVVGSAHSRAVAREAAEKGMVLLENNGVLPLGTDTSLVVCGGDRLTLRLKAEEIDLIKGLKQTGKKVVVCLFSGSAVLVDEWREYADAIIMHYYGGCEGGTALSNLLSGKVNFSGKLPFTVARSEEDYPSFKYIGQKPYQITYDYYHGYTKLDKEGKTAMYPFGYGLSYTNFRLSGVQVSSDSSSVTVQATIKNIGETAGSEVIQVYAGSTGAVNGKDRPVKALKGMKRVETVPGEEKTVEIVIPANELMFYDCGNWTLDPEYTIYVGTDSHAAAKEAHTVRLSD